MDVVLGVHSSYLVNETVLSRGGVGSIHRTDGGFLLKMLDGSPDRQYPSLEVAKSALHATLPAGSEWPDFREH